MQKVLFSLIALCSALVLNAERAPNLLSETPIGEKAAYLLTENGDRNSWLIRDGEGTATVTEARVDEKIGDAYVVSIDYSFDVMLYGSQTGNIGLLVPAAMFEEQFYEDLQNEHPRDVGSFEVDFLGMSRASDHESNTYDQCMLLRIYNIDPSYQPITRPQVSVLWHETVGILGSVENLNLKLKKHATVPVIGAVQIDISGRVKGFDIKAGFDFAPSLSR